MTEFADKLAGLTHRMVRIYIESGPPEGLPGFLLSADCGYAVLLSPETCGRPCGVESVTVIPFGKISAVTSLLKTTSRSERRAGTFPVPILLLLLFILNQ